MPRFSNKYFALFALSPIYPSFWGSFNIITQWHPQDCQAVGTIIRQTLKAVFHIMSFLLCEKTSPIWAFCYLCKSLDRNSSWQASSSLVISGPLYRILNMEQANTDRPKARSTRKGKPPDTSSEDSYNADGANHTGQCTWQSPSTCTHHTALSPTRGLTEQHQVPRLWDPGTAPNHEQRDGGTGMTTEWSLNTVLEREEPIRLHIRNSTDPMHECLGNSSAVPTWV